MTVRATALRWESDEFPGWIEVVVQDGQGRSQNIVDDVIVRFAEFVETTGGLDELTVAANDVRWL